MCVPEPVRRSSARTPMKTLASGEERRLGERREVLGLAVPVLVALVGRLRRDADREEGQQRGDEVGAGVDRLGDEAEAVRGEADRELQRDERAGGDDRDERGAPLRAQSSSSGQTRTSCAAAYSTCGSPSSATGASVLDAIVASPRYSRHGGWCSSAR